MEDIIQPFWANSITEQDIEIITNFLQPYYDNTLDCNLIKQDFFKFFRSRYKQGILLYVYQLNRIRNIFPKPNDKLEINIKVRGVRENSGVLVFSVFTSAYPKYNLYDPLNGDLTVVKDFDLETNSNVFSCKYNCYYCPDETNIEENGQKRNENNIENVIKKARPRSYLDKEPGVMRAMENDYDPVKQIQTRCIQYLQQGHNLDKAEVIIQGGTWDSYSIEYRTYFCRDIYYTFNTIFDFLQQKKLRIPMSLEEEIKINENAQCSVIGLTPETRPDQINRESIIFLRKIGATRVQLGIQHTFDDILKYINRGHLIEDGIRAIRLLKRNGFKVDVHIMPDLPMPKQFDNIQHLIDRQMLEHFLFNPDLKFDQAKIYPMMVTDNTVVKKWYLDGKYKPYGETKEWETPEYKKKNKDEKLQVRLNNLLYQNILYFYRNVHPSMRINRIIRDIPTEIVIGATDRGGLRSEIDQDMKLCNYTSQCIRYREIGRFPECNLEPTLKVLKFEASNGIEYFISFTALYKNIDVLYGFCRLRLEHIENRESNEIFFKELHNCALIRELHVYGKVLSKKKNNILCMSNNHSNYIQHRGLGKRLLQKAEEIAISQNYNKIAVISGVGVRNYYRKFGYNYDTEDGNYQVKYLQVKYHTFYFLFIFLLFIITPIMLSFQK